MPEFHQFIVLILTVLAQLDAIKQAAAQGTVQPFPGISCTSFLAVQCLNQPGTCCGVGGVCCAGGCCPITAMCINFGTSNEACCPVTDATLCGAKMPEQPSSTSCGPIKPSVQCVSVDDDWYCPPGAICGAVPSLCVGGRANEPCFDDDAAAALPTSSGSSSESSSEESEPLSETVDTATASSSSGVDVSTSKATPISSVTGAGAGAGASSSAAAGKMRALGVLWVVGVVMFVGGVV